MVHRYFLSLGGNVAPEASLVEAVRRLGELGAVPAVSGVYESPAVGTAEAQPNYLNAAALVESELEPKAFLQEVRRIEEQLGRVRSADRYAARPIDLDILLVDHEVMNIEHRPVPSPEILERDFVAVPLAEIAPEYIHPITGEPLAVIARRLRGDPGSLWLREDIILPAP